MYEHCNYLRLCEAAQVGHSLPYVCMYVYVCSHHSSCTNEGRMLKLGTDIHTDDLWSWYVFEVKMSRVKLTGSISTKKSFLLIMFAAVVTSGGNRRSFHYRLLGAF